MASPQNDRRQFLRLGFRAFRLLPQKLRFFADDFLAARHSVLRIRHSLYHLGAHCTQSRALHSITTAKFTPYDWPFHRYHPFRLPRAPIATTVWLFDCAALLTVPSRT